MHNLLIKRLKKRKSLTIQSSSILFILFSTLNILFIFCWNFFSNIYVFSYGYKNTDYYSNNVFVYGDLINKFPMDNIAISYNIENEVKDNSIVFKAYCSSNTFSENYGIKISNRIFFTIDVNDINKTKSLDQYCIVSENYYKTEGNITNNDISFPIAATFKLNMTKAIKDSLKSSDITDVKSVLFVEKDIDKNTSTNVILRGNEELAKQHDLISGKELNNQYITGYSTYLPLIYVGFLIPYIAAIICMFLILSSVQTMSLKENKTLYLLGMKKHKIFSLIFKERLIETLIGFIISSLIFIPIFIIYIKEFLYVSLINYLVQLIYVIIVLFFYTIKETNKKYK